MAKYLKPPAQPRILGSKEGSTFQRSGTVFSIRRKSKPTKKNTVKASISKNRFESSTSRWRTLSAPNKATWATESTNYPRTNSIGIAYTLRSQALQNSSSLNFFNSKLTAINSIPVAGALPALAFSFGVFDWSISNVQIEFTPLVIPANSNLRFDISQPQQAQVIPTSFSNYLQLVVLQSGQTQVQNFFSQVAQTIGSFQNKVGQRVYVRATLFDQTTGQIKSRLQIPIVIVG